MAMLFSICINIIFLISLKIKFSEGISQFAWKELQFNLKAYVHITTLYYDFHFTLCNTLNSL